MISSEMLRLGTSRSVIRELFEYGNQRAAVVGREHVFDFSLGNPSVPAPPEVAALLAKLVCEDPVSLHGYTSAPGAPEVRAAVAEDLNRRFAAGVSADHLYMTAGAAAALSACFKALALPGDEFVAIAPFFPEYRCFVEQGAGAKLVVCPAAQDFQIDLSALEGCLNEHTKAVIVNSPNNPSGAVYTRETLTALADLLRSASAKYGHPIYLISDEPYREIVYGVEVPWLPALYSNTLVCYSWSKSLSLPGQRIGYALVPPCVEDWQQVYAAVCGAGRALGYVNAPALFQRVVAQLPGNTSDLSVYRETAIPCTMRWWRRDMSVPVRTAHSICSRRCRAATPTPSAAARWKRTCWWCRGTGSDARAMCASPTVCSRRCCAGRWSCSAGWQDPSDAEKPHPAAQGDVVSAKGFPLGGSCRRKATD